MPGHRAPNQGGGQAHVRVGGGNSEILQPEDLDEEDHPGFVSRQRRATGYESDIGEEVYTLYALGGAPCIQMKTNAIFNPEPENDCDVFENADHNRTKRSIDPLTSNDVCPEGWWDNKYGSCIYYHDVKMTFNDAKVFCKNHAIGGAKLLEIKSNGTDSIKDYITLYDEIKKGHSSAQGKIHYGHV